MEFLTEAPTLQACPAPASAIAKPGIVALLAKWIGCEFQARSEQMTTPPTADDAVEEDWEKWLHGCGRGVR
jgi:hypothetical protein